jgi:hypothetical protein
VINLGGFRSGRRAATAVAALALVWAAAPSPAQASTDGIAAGLANSSVCLVSVSVTFATAATVLPGTVPPPDSTISVTATGTCYGTSTTSLSFHGTGSTLGAPSCLYLVSLQGGASVTLGTAPYQVTFHIAGPTAAPLMVIPATLGSIAGVGELAISPASLQACAQPGGTPSLQYTGVLAIVD